MTSNEISTDAVTVFAAMPFAAEYEDTFFVAMVAACEQVGAKCVRVDREDFSGDSVSKVESLIRQSSAVIADLSESRPNVLYEAGFAHALGIPVIPICSTQLEQLPFDIRNWNFMNYARGQTNRLREALAKRLRAIIQCRKTPETPVGVDRLRYRPGEMGIRKQRGWLVSPA